MKYYIVDNLAFANRNLLHTLLDITEKIKASIDDEKYDC